MPGSAQLTLELPDEATAKLGAPEQRALRDIAVDPQTHPDDLARLATSGYPESLVRLVAGNPSTPPDTLHLLSMDATLARQMAVAGDPKTSATTLARMAARLQHRGVLDRVAAHPSTPPAALASLVPKVSASRRLSLAERLNLNEQTMWALFNSRDSWGCSAAAVIARRSDAPIALLEKAADDPNLEVRLAAATNLQLPWSSAVRAVMTSHGHPVAGPRGVNKVGLQQLWLRMLQVVEDRAFVHGKTVQELAARAVVQVAARTGDTDLAAAAGLEAVHLWSGASPEAKMVFEELEAAGAQDADVARGDVVEQLHAALDACSPSRGSAVRVAGVARKSRSRLAVRR